MTFVPPASLGGFASAYPLAPATLHHQLVGHPLLTLDALADAAGQMHPDHVERRIADAANGGDFAMDDGGPVDTAQVIRSIASMGNWVMLRHVEQLPAYRALLHDLMTEIAPAIAPHTGAARAIKGFIFVSAPGTLTPFHFDCEYNILFQIAGDKQFATYPPSAPWLTLDRREAYHSDGANMLPWQDGYEDQAMVHALTPGDGLFVPYAAPHWVRAGAAPSISLSMTWQSAWSEAAGEAMQFNPLLRRLGLPAADLPQWPKAPTFRALGCRAARRAGLL